MASKGERMKGDWCQATRPRSGFVTTLAWISIVLSGFSTFMAVLQGVMFLVVFPSGEMRSMIYDLEAYPGFPPVIEFVLANAGIFFGLSLVFSCLTLVSSVGLLNRRNWARLTFIWILVLGVVGSIGGLFLQFHMFASIPAITQAAPEGLGDQIVLMVQVMKAAVVVFVVVSGAMSAWIITRLSSREVKAEFGRV